MEATTTSHSCRDPDANNLREALDFLRFDALAESAALAINFAGELIDAADRSERIRPRKIYATPPETSCKSQPSLGRPTRAWSSHERRHQPIRNRPNQGRGDPRPHRARPCAAAHASDLAVGDCIAVGTGGALGVTTVARVGASSCAIAGRVPAGVWGNVVISAGINDLPGRCVGEVRSRLHATGVVVWVRPINSAGGTVDAVAGEWGDRVLRIIRSGVMGCIRSRIRRWRGGAGAVGRLTTGVGEMKGLPVGALLFCQAGSCGPFSA